MTASSSGESSVDLGSLGDYANSQSTSPATAPRDFEPALFVPPTGTPPSYNAEIAIFVRLARSAGLRGEPGQPARDALKTAVRARAVQSSQHHRKTFSNGG